MVGICIGIPDLENYSISHANCHIIYPPWLKKLTDTADRRSNDGWSSDGERRIVQNICERRLYDYDSTPTVSTLFDGDKDYVDGEGFSFYVRYEDSTACFISLF